MDWVYEEHEGGLRYGYAVRESLYSASTPFQKLDVVDTVEYGRMMLLDGLVMITDQDEFVYHEMIAHVPALLHPSPKKVLVIGGGDGGTVRELLRHPEIDSITLCEIDGAVIDAAKKYFPNCSSGLSDPRVEVRVADGIQYVRDLEEESVDIIIVDSSDPVGPGVGLFTPEFYRDVARGLRERGMVVCQSESPWYDAEILRKIQSNVAAGFKYVRPYVGPVPTYPKGLWSWTLGAQTPIEPDRFSIDRMQKIADQLEYLSAENFESVFRLPNFYKRKLQH